MQNHIKLVTSPDDFNTKKQRYATDTKQKYLIRSIIHCLCFMFLCPRPNIPDYTYMKIILNRINEFKTYTVNSLKRERERGGGGEKEEKERRGVVVGGN